MDENRRTPLHLAANWAEFEVVQFLLAIGAKDQINRRDCTGRTPLHFAVRSAYTDVVHLLLDYGADINAPNLDGLTMKVSLFM